jgi:8-oxo-dGTP pyrophosphatase MutT (NUDIX family)
MSGINSAQIFARLAAGLSFQAQPWTGQGAQAGVLVALTDEPDPKVILGRRALHLRLHPGEIAFPGGKREAEDDSPWATALREAQEEVGIAQSLPEALGQLAPLVTRTGFEVYPCIAKVPAALNLIVDPGEFDSVFLPPLAHFADENRYRLEAMSVGERTAMVPHYQINDDNVWGVTAAVLAQLANIALDAGLDL